MAARTTKAELVQRVAELEQQVVNLEHRLKLKEQELQAMRDARKRAGRTPVFSPADHARIVADHDSGMTIRQVAANNHCSVGYVHKIINEHKKNEAVGE